MNAKFFKRVEIMLLLKNPFIKFYRMILEC